MWTPCLKSIKTSRCSTTGRRCATRPGGHASLPSLVRMAMGSPFTETSDGYLWPLLNDIPAEEMRLGAVWAGIVERKEGGPHGVRLPCGLHGKAFAALALVSRGIGRVISPGEK